jgi:hypothetical protein
LNPLHKNLPFLAKNKGVSVHSNPYFSSSVKYISESDIFNYNKT